jgi:hypothetical protein
MKMLLPVLAAVLLLAACGADDAPATATDPGATPAPSAVPAAPGTVHTRGLATVMDTGSPELCLGPVAESWPPQCGGPAIAGWDWADHGGMFETAGETRWGMFAVTGQWDGTTFTYESAVPAALYDAMAEEPPTYPAPAFVLSEGELEATAAKLGRELPGAQGAYAQDGHVLVDVTYDDGSLQDWVDQTYGDDVVIVTSMLVDEG